jgi:anti-sigma factor ChrR (cupin superfamily)
MTQACCPSCRLRFSRAAAAHLEACPHCAGPIHRIASAQDALGYSLFDIADPARRAPAAEAMALPAPRDPRERR